MFLDQLASVADPLTSALVSIEAFFLIYSATFFSPALLDTHNPTTSFSIPEHTLHLRTFLTCLPTSTVFRGSFLSGALSFDMLSILELCFILQSSRSARCLAQSQCTCSLCHVCALRFFFLRCLHSKFCSRTSPFQDLLSIPDRGFSAAVCARNRVTDSSFCFVNLERSSSCFAILFSS